MFDSDETIFALATPPGKSGVAVLRISGNLACHALQKLIRADTPAPRQATLRSLYPADETEPLDRALIIYFPTPHSFTGEDVVELHVHGSRAVKDALLGFLSAMPGLRLASPGEFSRRALMNGKMDLLEIEGLSDLINAETEAQRRQALRLLEGKTGQKYHRMRVQILHALSLLEAYIDFPDEEIPKAVHGDIATTVDSLLDSIENILNDGKAGERIREGFSVVILGAPNAGKSSLLNALAKRDVAIVSDIPGTTRDSIELHMDIGGYPVVVIDTAGLRESSDPVEQEGIRRAMAHARYADITLVLFDATLYPQMDHMFLDLCENASLILFTKSDLAHPPLPSEYHNIPCLPLSVETGDGLDRLLSEINVLLKSRTNNASEVLITHHRHRVALERAKQYLEIYRNLSELELACEQLRLAADALGGITGKILVDEVLDQIFRQFCIGK